MIHRQLDSTQYFVQSNWTNKAQLHQLEDHQFELEPADKNSTFEFSVSFSPLPSGNADLLFNEAVTNRAEGWDVFWNSRGAIDFSKCTDPWASIPTLGSIVSGFKV